MQTADELVNIAAWEVDEEFGVFPIGSKPKRLVRCPADNTQPFLIPGHRYLFKGAHGRQGMQFWSEVIAYRVSVSSGLAIPPCFVAMDGNTGEVGALVEFFYGHPGEPEPLEFVAAADYLQKRYGVGARTDRPHNIWQILELCREYNITDPVSWWAGVLTFDALIGNTDRHPENWGFLKSTGSSAAAPLWALAPPFDNGTSLGWGVAEDNLGRADDPVWLARYLDRGTHHCGWDPASDSKTSHFGLCQRFFDEFPEVQPVARQVAQTPDLDQIVRECVRFDVSLPFTRDRARFVSTVVAARKRRLSAILGADSGKLD